MLANQRTGQPSLLTDRPMVKNTILVEIVEYLFLVKFCQNPFNSCRGEAENVLAN